MFKQLVKYTVIALVWKKYRGLIIATGILFIYFWLVGKLHADFLAYMALKDENSQLGMSFLMKWGAFILGLVCYFVYLYYWHSPKTNTKIERPEANTTKQDIESSAKATESEKFERIRSKPVLRSRSDMVIDKYPEKK